MLILKHKVNLHIHQGIYNIKPRRKIMHGTMIMTMAYREHFKFTNHNAVIMRWQAMTFSYLKYVPSLPLTGKLSSRVGIRTYPFFASTAAVMRLIMRIYSHNTLPFFSIKKTLFLSFLSFFFLIKTWTLFGFTTQKTNLATENNHSVSLSLLLESTLLA